MPRLQPKSISIDACDDLFDTEDEGGGTSEDHHEEEEEYTSNRIKKSELNVGTLVNARDSSVNDTKYGSGVRKQSYTAFIVEPGISDDGTMIWISWVQQKKKKQIPLESIDEIVSFDSKPKRKRNTLKLPMNLPVASPNQMASNSTPPPGREHSASPDNPRKKRKGNSNSKAQVSSVPRAKEVGYNGKPVEIITLENNSTLYYLKHMFGDNILIIQGELNGELQKLDKIISKYGIDFHLVVSKLKEGKNAHMKAQYDMMNKALYVAYYLGGPGFDTADEVKRKLEDLGDFSKIALNYGKMCARLELMVSPSCAQYPRLFELKSDEFELIEENQHVGCGFAPPAFFEKILKKGPRHRKFKDYFAIQIRMFCPKLGWFKGMLMKKPSITKVQLPESMMKIQQSRSLNLSDEAYFSVKRTFPSDSSAGVRNKLENKKKPTKSALAKIEPLKFSYIVLLESHGICQDDWKQYEQSCYDDDGKAYCVRDDDHIVGVADPTSCLPNDSVFVTGLKAIHCADQVFITRYPCNEKSDGKLLKAITSRPNGMSSEDWKYLASIPYGILVFGPSSTPTSLPEQIAKGDLDGDLYHVLWDFTIVKKIEEFHSRNMVNMTSSSESSGSHHHNNVARDIMLKNPGVYDDSRLNYRDEQEPVGIRAVLDIIGHHRGEIRVRWESIADKKIFEAWEQLKDMKNEITETVAQYGLDNKLQDQLGWKWIKEHIRVTELKCIVSHTEDNGKITFVARYDDGSDEERKLDEMKEDAPDILFKYANENSLLHQWRTEYLESTMGNWFENAQTYSAELKHLYYQSKLMKALHREWKKRVNMGDTEAADALSGAYKKSLEYRKHATSITLPICLTKYLPRNLRHCVIPT